mgnify:FL=1
MRRASQDATALELDAQSTERLYVTEVMGRDCGELTFGTFRHSRASMALIPETPFNIEKLIEHIAGMNDPRGLLLVAEGAEDQDLMWRHAADIIIFREALASGGIIPQGLIDQHFPLPQIDAFGNVKKGGIADMVTFELQQNLPQKIPIVRMPDLGYQYRSMDPLKADLDLAEMFAKEAVSLLLRGKRGRMVAMQNGRISSLPLADVVGKKRSLQRESYR